MMMIFLVAAAVGTTSVTMTTTTAFTIPPPTKQLRHIMQSSSRLVSSAHTQGYLDSLSNIEADDNTNTNTNTGNFWGAPRNEREIIDFISEAVFNDMSHHDAASNALNDYVAPTIDQHLQRIEVISEEPPLVMVHGFLSHEHCDHIMNAVIAPANCHDENSKHQLKRSTMGADQDESQQRTSSTAWLHPEHCPAPLDAFSERVSNLSGLPTNNFENLQVVRYEPGQEFQLHTDHLDSFNDMDCGGRLATCLMYLNDSEDAAAPGSSNNNDEAFTGGETFFHEFDFAASPRKGSALFWWNTIERPGSDGYDKNMFLNVDVKLRHAGLPVLTGEKWICNKWLHPLPFPFGE